MVAVEINRHKIPDAISLVLGLGFDGRSPASDFVTIKIDLIAKDADRATANRPLMSGVGAQVKTCVACTNPGIIAKAKVFRETEHLRVVP